MTPQARLQQCLAATEVLSGASRIFVAYSGGLDSHVLLHALVAWLGPQRVTAIHVNHQLSPDADRWASHCRQICAGLGVNCLSEKVNVVASASLENAARQARYAVFAGVLGNADVLALAHHADDQAETVLYRLLRRSGPRGLAGMPMTRPLGSGTLLRPLLNIERDLLRQYAEAEQLVWIDDETNLSLRHDRNLLRHRVIPQIKVRWPDYAARISASADLSRQAEGLNEDLARIDLNQLAQRDERYGRSVLIAPLVALGRVRQANVLRFLARLDGHAAPGHQSLYEVLDSLLAARQDANPVVHWSGGEWRRFRQRLYLLPTPMATAGIGVDKSAENRRPWTVTEPFGLANGSRLVARSAVGQGLATRLCEHLTVAFRSGGERCQPAGRAGSASLKKLFQEYALEPWLRASVPLVYRGDELVAVGDLWVCEGFQALQGEPGYVLRWRFPGASATDGAPGD